MNADAAAFQDTASFGLFSLLATLGPLVQLIVVVILAAFCVGLWAAFGMWRRLRQEAAALDKAQANSRLMQEGSTTRDPDIAAVLTADVMPADALICRRIYDLQEMRDKNMDLQRDAFTATSAARLNLGMSVLRYVSGILILIGLVGTLTGLTQAVIGLSIYQPPSETIEAKQKPDRDDPLHDLRTRISNIHGVVQKLLNSIEQALLGMRTAFLASLLAIALTIVLSFCAHRVQDRLTHFLTALEDFTTKELLPLFTPPKNEAVLQDLVTSVQGGTEQLSSVVEEIEDRAVQMGENLDKLLMLVHEFDTGRQRFDGSVTLLTEQQGRLLDGHAHLNETVKSFLEAVNRLGQSEEAMRQAFAQLQTFCEENAELGNVVRQGVDFQSTFHQELQRFNDLGEDFLQNRLTPALDQQYQHLSEWSKSRDRANQILTSAFGHSQAVQQTTNDLLKQLLERQDSEHQHTGEQMTQLLLHQQQSSQGISRTVELLQHQQNLTASLDAAGQQSITVQQGTLNAMRELTQTLTALPAERTLLAERLDALNASQSLYFQESLAQQRDVATSLQRFNEVIAQTAQSRGLWGRVRRFFS